LLQQDTAQLVDDLDEEALFPAAHLESRQLQYQRAAQRIADRAAQAHLKEDMLQLKQTTDEKHNNIGSLNFEDLGCRT
jgi:hypothetical protein